MKRVRNEKLARKSLDYGRLRASQLSQDVGLTHPTGPRSLHHLRPDSDSSPYPEGVRTRTSGPGASTNQHLVKSELRLEAEDVTGRHSSLSTRTYVKMI